ncbi:MAG TPA: hypothetical protein VF746_18470 [Longimicrobium sp.]|jgi:hypothetical protein
MEYKHLGRTGLQVSRLALATMNFGWTADEAAGFQIMDAALDAGINLDGLAVERLEHVGAEPYAPDAQGPPGRAAIVRRAPVEAPTAS